MTDALQIRPLEAGRFRVFTDGAVSGNGTAESTGGWAFLVQTPDGGPLWTVSAGVPTDPAMPPTNIRMEQTAVAEALAFLPAGSTIEIYADLEMISKVMAGIWEGKANKDLWQRIHQERRRHARVDFRWIKGHVSKKDAKDCPLLAGNRVVDALAVAAKKDLRPRLIEDVSAGLPEKPAKTVAAKKQPLHIDKPILLDYTNWRGERGVRRVVPIRCEYGANEWHKTPQWLMIGWDLEKQAERTFALSGIHSMQPA